MVLRAVVLSIVMLLWSGIPAEAAQGAAGPPSMETSSARQSRPQPTQALGTTARLGGGTPTEHAAAISRARFTDAAADHVVLARDDVFADSLAGTALLAAGPMLLVAGNGVPPETLEELRRVLAAGGRVYVLGGRQAIEPVVEVQLSGMGYDVVRLAGPSRVETSVAVAQEVLRLNPEADAAVLARADAAGGHPTAAWADSVTGGGWAARTSSPVLVTPSAELHPAVAGSLQEMMPARTVLLGGTAALSQAVEQAVPRPQRVAGGNRAGTAAAVAAQLWEADPQAFVLINAYADDGWAYGLPAAGVAADAQAPLLVSPASGAPPEIVAALTAACDEDPGVELVLAGGPEQLSGDLAAELDGAIGSACAAEVPDGCNPNYSGCVPVAADVDCEGGVGDCPAYVEGPVQIVGEDVYGLDHDGDGTGCEA